MRPEIGYVYWIHHEYQTDPTEEGYIGVSYNPSERLKQHKARTENPLLAEALASDSNIVMNILFIGSYECALLREKCFRPKKNIGWNIAAGGGSPPNQKGVPKSQQTKEKMSLNNVGFKGKRHSENTVKRMREAHANRAPITEETRRKISEALRGKSRSRSQVRSPHSEETKRKISESLKTYYAK